MFHMTIFTYMFFKMNRTISILPVLCFFFIISCKSTHQTPYDFNGSKLIFGNGGGFSGKVTEYTLLSNGEFYKGLNKEGVVYSLDKLQKKRIDQIFTNYDVLKFNELDINRPGNMYNFIVMNKGNTSHRIQWANYDEEIPENLRIYFKNLMTMAKELNKKESKSNQPTK